MPGTLLSPSQYYNSRMCAHGESLDSRMSTKRNTAGRTTSITTNVSWQREKNSLLAAKYVRARHPHVYTGPLLTCNRSSSWHTTPFARAPGLNAGTNNAVGPLYTAMWSARLTMAMFLQRMGFSQPAWTDRCPVKELATRSSDVVETEHQSQSTLQRPQPQR
jgi:hypothetical protein